jgi:predicted RNA binding protein YcfA (HicA-like mRNA interferase family)
VSPKLRRLSGREVIAVLQRFGFQAVSQRGSHIKLRRIAEDGAKQTLTIPAHSELDAGTISGIFRQAARYIVEDELRPHFYSD